MAHARACAALFWWLLQEASLLHFLVFGKSPDNEQADCLYGSETAWRDAAASLSSVWDCAHTLPHPNF